MVVLSPLTDAELDLLFRALADTTRRDILRRTLDEEASVSQLASSYEMSFAAIQKHVAVLETAGLVHKRAVGRERLVRADAAQIGRARNALAQLEDIWRHRIHRLDQLLAEPPESSCP